MSNQHLHNSLRTIPEMWNLRNLRFLRSMIERKTTQHSFWLRKSYDALPLHTKRYHRVSPTQSLGRNQSFQADNHMMRRRSHQHSPKFWVGTTT